MTFLAPKIDILRIVISKFFMRLFLIILCTMDPALYTNHTIVFFEKGTCHQVTFQFSIWLPFKTNEAQNIPFSTKIV